MEKYFIKLAKLIISRISEDFKDEVKKKIIILEKIAKKTDNPFDDMFIETLKIVFDIDKNLDIDKKVDIDKTPEKGKQF